MHFELQVTVFTPYALKNDTNLMLHFLASNKKTLYRCILEFMNAYAFFYSLRISLAYFVTNESHGCMQGCRKEWFLSSEFRN